MASETLARRYATAIFGLAQEQNVAERVGSELDAISRAIAADARTHDFFLAPIVDRSVKEQMLLAALGESTHAIALHTLLLLIRKRRMNLLAEIVRQYRGLEAGARGVEPLTIMTARDISPEELRRTVERLQDLYAKRFDVTVQHDPHLIGGVRLAMGDRRIDGSVAGRLEELSRSLFAQGAQ